MDKWNTDLIFRQTGGPVDLHAKLKAAGYTISLQAVRSWCRRGSIPADWIATIARVTDKDPRKWIVGEPDFDPEVEIELEIAARYVRGQSGVTIAREIELELREDFTTFYDQGGAIGRRYRRQDEIGTPYCITIDYDTLEDNTVTIRDRDSMEQKRVKIEKLEEVLE